MMVHRRRYRNVGLAAAAPMVLRGGPMPVVEAEYTSYTVRQDELGRARIRAVGDGAHAGTVPPRAVTGVYGQALPVPVRSIRNCARSNWSLMLDVVVIDAQDGAGIGHGWPCTASATPVAGLL